MSEVTAGILVGILVALASQILSFLFTRFREAQREQQLAERTAVFLLGELLHNQEIVNRLVKLAVANSYAGLMQRPSAEFINGLQSSLVEFKTQVYEQVFMRDWHLLKHQVFLGVNLYYYRLLQLITDLRGYVNSNEMQAQLIPKSLELNELRDLRALGEEVRASLEEQAAGSLSASGLAKRGLGWERKGVFLLHRFVNVARRWL